MLKEILTIGFILAFTVAKDFPVHVGIEFPHRNIALGFPEQVGEWPRGKTTTFDKVGDNVGIGYDRHRPKHQISATIYIYPRGASSADDELDKVLKNIRLVHPGLSLPTRSVISTKIGNREFSGEALEFVYTGRFWGENLEVRGAAWLFQSDKYWIKVRYTVRADQAKEADQVVRALLQGLIWKKVK